MVGIASNIEKTISYKRPQHSNYLQIQIWSDILFSVVFKAFMNANFIKYTNDFLFANRFSQFGRIRDTDQRVNFIL
jgi:hypothetical protein